MRMVASGCDGCKCPQHVGTSFAARNEVDVILLERHDGVRCKHRGESGVQGSRINPFGVAEAGIGFQRAAGAIA